jgi:ribonuclease P/MRP protein subunit RPP40
MPNKSCCTNLLEALDIVTQALEEGLSIDIAFLDFAKAFDSVAHERLLLKLKAYGIREDLLRWFKGYLSDRIQRVVLGENTSEWKKVTSGVPQGSVIGPLLFVIYINDLMQDLKNSCKLYADDTKVISVINKIEDNINMQKDLNKLVKWSENWLIDFNKDKCKIMHIGKNNPNYDYFMCNEMTMSEQNIPRMPETILERDLGVMISNDMKWEKHIETIVAKANRKLGQIKHSFTHLDENSMKLLYTSLVRPHLEFAAPIWNPYFRKDIVKLENVQHRATRIHGFKGVCYEDRLQKFELTTLETRRERGDMIQYYKINKSIDQVNWSNPPKVNNNSKTRGHNQKLQKQLIHVSVKRFYFFTNRIVNKWNSLTEEVVSSNNVNIFKNNFDRFEKINKKNMIDK